jgi:DNA-binding NtrC family response regulator
VLREAPAHGVRIIADSLETADALAESGEFSDELAAVFARQSIPVPPLDDYADDIAEIVALIAKRLIAAHEVAARPLSAAAVHLLSDHRWNGGFTALHAAVRNALLSAAGEVVGEDEVRAALRHLAERSAQIVFGEEVYKMPLREAREVFEREYFVRLLHTAQGNYQRAAQLAGLERTYLYRKFKQLHLVGDNKE